MSKIRSKGNKTTEIKLIQILKSIKLNGWRRNYKLFGKPDIVFPKLRLAIFVDGCFWHGCRQCGLTPKSNWKFWRIKLENNQKRDKRVNSNLKKMKWKVLRFWEHNLSNSKAVIERITRKIEGTTNAADRPSVRS